MGRREVASETATVFVILEAWEAEREDEGWTVDHTCWPWLAYMGPRFDPTDTWSFGEEPRRCWR